MSATVILVHGAFCNARSWEPVRQELESRGIRAVTVDLPGHGGPFPSGYADAPQNLDSLATAPSPIAGIGTADDVAAVV